MNADWYCVIDGQQQGPMTAVRLKQLATSGKLEPVDPVWREGMQTKKPASTVKGLFADPKRLPAPPQKKPGELVEFEVLEAIEEVEDVEVVEDVKPAKRKPGKAADDVEEVEEVYELKQPPAKPKPPAQKAGKIITEAEVTYRGGFSDLEPPLTGTFLVQSDGVCFRFEVDEEDEEYFIAYDLVEDVMEPARGDFPEATKRLALGSKIGGMGGRLASGVIGNLIGDTAGKVVGGIGKEASRMVEESGNLGKPPRNRIAINATVRKKHCRLLFDTIGKTREEMNEDAAHLYRQIRKARDAARAEEEDVVEDVAVDDEEDEAPVKKLSATPVAGPPAGRGGTFRVLSGGTIKGPFPVRDLSAMIASGAVGEKDLIGVETWLPVFTLLGMGAGAASVDVSVSVGGKVAGKGPAVRQGAVKADEAPKTVKSDDDSIPLDAEFNID